MRQDTALSRLETEIIWPDKSRVGLIPVESSQIREAAAAGSDANELISSAGKVSSEQFNRKVEKLIDKHKDK